MTSGLDTNLNNVLDAAEVTSTAYICNGADGATGATGATGPAGPGVTWVEVTTASAQAESNKGYLANSSSQVTVTLPTAPAIGDIVQVSGLGSGGWKIAQNAGQAIVTRNLPNGIGALWVERTPLTYTDYWNNSGWRAVGMSPNGAWVHAGQGCTSDSETVPISQSQDNGASWFIGFTDPNFNCYYTSLKVGWTSIACGHDQCHAVSPDFGIARVTSGGAWRFREGITATAIATSADGTRVVAAGAGAPIYLNAVSGAWPWTTSESPRNWSAVASSPDGTVLAATVNGGQIYISSDAGATWTPHGPSAAWSGIAMSADGIKLVATVNAGQIYTSTDSGTTWTARESNRNWSAITSSTDGTRLAATVNGGRIYVSRDSGLTWEPREQSRNWSSIASSADGSKIIAGHTALGGNVSISQPYTTTGTAGGISGEQYEAIELQYIGNNTFTILSYVGDLTVQ